MSEFAKVMTKAAVKVRKRLSRRSSVKMTDSLVLLGTVDSRNELATTLHNAAMMPTKSKLKKLLHQGLSISIDFPNSLGQTPLFSACAVSNDDTASLLLQHGADPNVQDRNGVNSVHLVCYTGNTDLLAQMMEAGADVGIKDNRGHGVMEWASRNNHVHLKTNMLACLHKSRALTTVPAPRVNREQKNTGVDTPTHNKRSASGKIPKTSVTRDSSCTILSVVPLIPVSILTTLEDYKIYGCGLDWMMTQMVWHVTPVSVKRVRDGRETKEQRNMVLAEATYLSKLRHPNVITLMAMCQPHIGVGSTALVLERVQYNMYHCLHSHKDVTFPPDLCVTLAIQTCSAIGYIHSQGFLHTSLSSHAIYLTENVTVKLGNFEFMMDSSQSAKGHYSRVTSHPDVHDLYPWMAPEVICGASPSSTSDVYSFGCFIWELFSSQYPQMFSTYILRWVSNHLKGRIPWDGIYQSDRAPLPMESIPQEVQAIIHTATHQQTQDMATKRQEHTTTTTSLDHIYSCLTHVKKYGILNRSHNSNTKDVPSTSPGQTSARSQEENVSQDKLVFPMSVQPEDRSGQSTSAFTIPDPNMDNTEDSPGMLVAAQTKNGSKEFDACHQAIQHTPPTTRTSWAIKPASHHYSPPRPFMSKTAISTNNPATTTTDTPNATPFMSGLKDWRHKTQTTREESPISHPACTVKQLANDYHQIIEQHKLRQEILKGSMAPHGGCEDTQSPLDSIRWHSLPSTIRELSKTWSGEEETPKTVLSDNISMGCLTSPQVKQTSTPLHPDMDRSVGARSLGLRYFFKGRHKKHKTGQAREMDLTPGRKSQVESSQRQKSVDVLEEMKSVQSSWKWRRRWSLGEEGEDSVMGFGVSYNSPTIQPRICTDMNHTTLLQGDDGNCDGGVYDDDGGGTDNLSVDGKDHDNVHHDTGSACVDNGGIGGDKVTVVDTKEVGVPNNGGGGGRNDGAGVCSLEKVEDSFWGLSVQCALSTRDDGMDAGGCYTQIHHQKCETGIQNPTTVHEGVNGVCALEMETSMDQTKRVSQDRGGDNDKALLDGTYIVDCDTTEPDSWFLSSGPPSQLVSNAMSGAVTKQCRELDEMRCEDKPDVLPLDAMSGVVGEVVKTFGEFEIQEFYIDDDLDTSESIQPVPSNHSDQLTDNSDSVEDEAEKHHPLGSSPPSPTHNPGLNDTTHIDHDVIANSSNRQMPNQNSSECTTDVEPKEFINLSEEVPDVKHHKFHPSEHVSEVKHKETYPSEQVPDVKNNEFHTFEHLSNVKHKEMYPSEQVPDIQRKELHPSEGVSDAEKKECPPCKCAPNVEHTEYHKTEQKKICATKNCISQSISPESISPTCDIDEETIGDINEKIALFGGCMKSSAGLVSHSTQPIKKCDFSSQADTGLVAGGRVGVTDTGLVGGGCVGVADTGLVEGGRVGVEHGSRIRLIPKVRTEDSTRVMELGEDCGSGALVDNGSCRNEDRAQDDVYCNDGDTCGGDGSCQYEIEDDGGVSESDKLDSRLGYIDNVTGRFVRKDYTDDCDDWVSERLRLVQDKIRRRRQRRNYTISSEEEEEERERGQTFDIWGDMESNNPYFEEWSTNCQSENCSICLEEGPGTTDNWSSYQEDRSRRLSMSSYNNKSAKAISVSSSDRFSLPPRIPLTRPSFSKWSVLSKPYLPTQSNDIMLGPDSEVAMVMRNEGRSVNGLDLPTVSKSFSPATNRRRRRYHRSHNHHHSLFRAPQAVHPPNGEWKREHDAASSNSSVHYPVLHPRRRNSQMATGGSDGGGDFGNIRSNESRSTMRTVMFEDEADGLRQFSPSRESTADDLGEVTCCDTMDCHPLDRTFNVDHCDSDRSDCVMLGLTHNDDRDNTGVCQEAQTIGGRVYTEVHRFYIPKHEWPDGCKTQLHVSMSPTQPGRHRVSTTAMDPTSGRKQVLMTKTLDTDTLHSHLTID